MINDTIKSVLYCLPPGHSIAVPDFIRKDKGVIFHEGIPDFNKFTDGKSHLIILDDLMSQTDSNCMDLFTRQSHHRHLSVVLLVQNCFYGGNKFFRTISLNSHYLILMKNPRDRIQIRVSGIDRNMFVLILLLLLILGFGKSS